MTSIAPMQAPQPLPPAVANPVGIDRDVPVATVTYTLPDGSTESRQGNYFNRSELGTFTSLNDAVQAARSLTYDEYAEDGQSAFHGTYSAAVVLGNDGKYHAGELIDDSRDPSDGGVSSPALPIDGMYFTGGNGYSQVYAGVDVTRMNDRLQAVVGADSWIPFTAE